MPTERGFVCFPQSQRRLRSVRLCGAGNITVNEKQYAYVAGFQSTIVSKLHKCFFLAQCFNLPQKPAIITYCMLAVLSFVNLSLIKLRDLLFNLICFNHTIEFYYFIIFNSFITIFQLF
jgi:hypothetical protein